MLCSRIFVIVVVVFGGVGIVIGVFVVIWGGGVLVLIVVEVVQLVVGVGVCGGVVFKCGKLFVEIVMMEKFGDVWFVVYLFVDGKLVDKGVIVFGMLVCYDCMYELLWFDVVGLKFVFVQLIVKLYVFDVMIDVKVGNDVVLFLFVCVDGVIVLIDV